MPAKHIVEGTLPPVGLGVRLICGDGQAKYCFIDIYQMFHANRQIHLNDWLARCFDWQDYHLVDEFDMPIRRASLVRAWYYACSQLGHRPRTQVDRAFWIPGSKRSWSFAHYYRTFRTQNERRQLPSYREELAEAGMTVKRRRLRLPNNWDDIPRCQDRNWKRHRRHQWK